MNALAATAQALMACGKGLLAMDEPVGTCNRRLAEHGIAPTDENRRRCRALRVTTAGLSESISGAILFDATLTQRTHDGMLFVDVLRSAGIVVGIQVDAGAQGLAGHPGERDTDGLDGLRKRLKQCASAGAGCAKWRAVLTIGDRQPSRACIDANAHALARHAALCQEAQIVPVVEPGVLMEGAPCLRRSVPAAVAGVACWSGGQPARLATARLHAMHRRTPTKNLASQTPPCDMPWPLTFSGGRVLQEPALRLWAGADANRDTAQRALLHRARCNAAAVWGDDDPALDVQALPT